ncbi:hypothetical protein D7030_12050 [Flavobacteriaceae bacterium AU392]|nr:hypothetical protein D1817_12615 [Flavobacteriaceae bacterium]RKM82880.1 hypothetical protein D7030_12050 [Flavobacteriaceae bacterium AU392]
MLKTKCLILFFGLLSFILKAQTTQIKGIVFGNSSLEGIHVINKSSKTYATTNAEGVFTISAKALDTIQVSSILYETKTIIVSFEDFKNKRINVYLNEAINQLNEVLVGKILTGNLNSDIANSDAERPLDFYDLGIPGYTGPKKTLAERELFDADGGGWISDVSTNGLGAGGALNLNKILNAVSGRTKKLKRNVDLERRTNLINRIKEELSEIFFNTNALDKKHRTDFFYFCSEDKDFLRRCGSNDFEALKFLQEKLIIYKNNLASNKD